MALYLFYLALSLLDPWGYMPPMVQLAVVGGLFLLMMIALSRGLRAKTTQPLTGGLKAVFLSVALLSIAGIWAGSDARRLLEIAVKPRALFSYPVPEIIMTVRPPAYSGREEFTVGLIPDQEQAAGLDPIPEGSEITVRVKNTPYAPHLVAGDQSVAFLPGEQGDFVARFTLKDEVSWQLRDGSRRIGQWPIIILEDEAPTLERVEFHQMMTGDGLFGLSLDLFDDYGLAEVAVGVVPPGGETKILYDRTRLAVSDLKNFSGDIYVNLSSSDFAGHKVDLVLEAVDQAGQKQQKILADISLPAKEFTNPHSRQIIEIREGVARQPEKKQKLARQLMALGLVPDDGQTPMIYYIALRSAYWRLVKPSGEDDLKSAQDILWHLACMLEDGEKGPFSSDILSLLASLKLTLHQRGDVAEVRKHLQEIDKRIILFLRAQVPSLRGQYVPENYNIKELRRIYGEILTHVHNEKFNPAIDLISYLEHGFIYSGKGILSGQGYERFQTVQRARDTVNSLEKTQRKVMSFVYKKTVRLEFASAEATDGLKIPFNKAVHDWVVVQKKLGETVNELGRTLLMSGIDASQLTVAASDLVRDAAQSMAAGDMEVAAQYQSEILTLLKSLKIFLDREIQFYPTRKMTH